MFRVGFSCGKDHGRSAAFRAQELFEMVCTSGYIVNVCAMINGCAERGAADAVSLL